MHEQNLYGSAGQPQEEMTEEQGPASFPTEPALKDDIGGSGVDHKKKEEEATIPPTSEAATEEQQRWVSWKILLLAGGMVVIVVAVVVAVVMSTRTVSEPSSSSSSISVKEDSSRSSATNTPPDGVPSADPSASSNTQNKKKNIILIIADDLGIRDLGCYNPNDTNRFYETPHLDQLAMDADAVLFENAYSAHATCAESRAGLFTGMFPSRLGVVDIGRTATFHNLGFRKERVCLRRADEMGRGEQKVPLAAVTLPEALSQHHGYRTALIGKWHSGLPSGRGLPDEHGFEITIGNTTGLGTHFSPYRCGTSKCKTPPSNLSQVPDGTFITDHLTAEAVSLLENEFASSNSNASPAPFLLVLSHYAVHTPIESKEGIKQHFRRKRAKLNHTLDVYLTIDGLLERQTQDHPVYAGLLKSLDDSVGTLLQSVRDLGLENDTIIMFTSDNGGKSSNWNWQKAKVGLTSNLPFKAAKEYIGDGGIRIPLIVKAPGLQGRIRVVQPPQGHRTLFQSHGVDYFPTLLELAGLPLQPQDHVDGVSLVPAMQGTATKRGEPMFWQDPAECFISSTNASQHKCTDTSYAVIAAQWKFIKRIYSKENDDDATLELYNIEVDPGERINLAYNESYAQELDEMEQTLLSWQKTWFQTPYFERLRAMYNNCT